LVTSAQNTVTRTKKYIQDEGTVLPKAAAITVGGMSGFLLGMKRGGVITRSFYSGLGMAVVAAFCYPYETVDLARVGVRSAQGKWDQFVSPPSPPAIVEKELDVGAGASKDISLYTTRSKKID